MNGVTTQYELKRINVAETRVFYENGNPFLSLTLKGISPIREIKIPRIDLSHGVIKFTPEGVVLSANLLLGIVPYKEEKVFATITEEHHPWPSPPKEMTQAEIEKELGYKIKIKEG